MENNRRVHGHPLTGVLMMEGEKRLHTDLIMMSYQSMMSRSSRKSLGLIPTTRMLSLMWQVCREHKCSRRCY